MNKKICFKTGRPSSLTAKMSAALLSACILSASLSACATAPQIREIDGPIILDAPDSVVRAEPDRQASSQALPQEGQQSAPQSDPAFDPYPYEEVQSVPVTPINCPPGSSPQSDGSCMLVN